MSGRAVRALDIEREQPALPAGGQRDDRTNGIRRLIAHKRVEQRSWQFELVAAPDSRVLRRTEHERLDQPLAPRPGVREKRESELRVPREVDDGH